MKFVLQNWVHQDYTKTDSGDDDNMVMIINSLICGVGHLSISSESNSMNNASCYVNGEV